MTWFGQNANPVFYGCQRKTRSAGGSPAADPPAGRRLNFPNASVVFHPLRPGTIALQREFLALAGAFRYWFRPFAGLRRMKTLHVLNAPLLVTDYDELAAHCLTWAREPRCRTVEFVNTQIVTMIRHDAAFRECMSVYDGLLPDGMPLVWCLNRAGAGLRDRVYGPTFMRKFLETSPAGTTHYLLGGSAECGARLREIFMRRNSNVKFVGAFHGRCGADGLLEGAAEKEVIEELNRLSPDFIWVGFGTPKQQAWARQHKHLIRRGIILTVGFAFDANAGLKPDAPLWMQRNGLTWLYRLITEPRRLGGRYLKWNTLFLFYLLRDGLGGHAWGKLDKG